MQTCYGSSPFISELSHHDASVEIFVTWSSHQAAARASLHTDSSSTPSSFFAGSTALAGRSSGSFAKHVFTIA